MTLPGLDFNDKINMLEIEYDFDSIFEGREGPCVVETATIVPIHLHGEEAPRLYRPRDGSAIGVRDEHGDIWLMQMVAPDTMKLIKGPEGTDIMRAIREIQRITALSLQEPYEDNWKLEIRKR